MNQNNLRSYLIELMNDLVKIGNNTTNPEQRQRVTNLLRILFVLLDEVIKQQLDRNTEDYKKALEGLKKAEKATKKALQDISKVANATKRVAKAAKLVDKVLGAVISIL